MSMYVIDLFQSASYLRAISESESLFYATELNTLPASPQAPSKFPLDSSLGRVGGLSIQQIFNTSNIQHSPNDPLSIILWRVQWQFNVSVCGEVWGTETRKV